MPDVHQRQPRTTTPAAKPTTQTVPVANSEIDLIELMYRLLASWKLIVCLALICAIAAGAYATYNYTPLYQATSVIYVVGRNDSAINISDLQLGTALTPDYLKVFDIWEVHAQVIKNLNLPYSYGRMRGMVSARNTTGTRMLDITVTSTNPQEAATIANEYASVVSQYIADTMARDKPNIMSVALVPTNPINGGKTKNVTQGFLIGALLAVAIVTLRMLLDDKYKTAEDIRKYTGLVTLAVIPVDDAMSDKKTQNEKHSRRDT